MSAPLPPLLQWADVINVSAVSDDIDVVQTDDLHRVVVEVPLANIQSRLDWVRTQGSFAPIGYWKVGDVSSLFFAVGNSSKVDRDAGELTFTTISLDEEFSNETANDFVIPYVLYKLFGKSTTQHESVPNYEALKTDDPLLSSIDFAAEFNTQITQSSIGTDVSGEAANKLFKDLIIAASSRFGLTTDDPPNPVLSPDPYIASTVKGSANGELNPWQLKKDDIIQFTVKFTFANSITVKATNGTTVNSINDGTTYSIRLQIKITA